MAEDAPSAYAAGMFWRNQQRQQRDDRDKASARRDTVTGRTEAQRLAQYLSAFEAAQKNGNEQQRAAARQRLEEFARDNPRNETARAALEIGRINERHSFRDQDGRTRAMRDADKGENNYLDYLQHRQADMMTRFRQLNPESAIANAADKLSWLGDPDEERRVAEGRQPGTRDSTPDTGPAPDYLMRAARRNPYSKEAQEAQTPPPPRAAYIRADGAVVPIRPDWTVEGVGKVAPDDPRIRNRQDATGSMRVRPTTRPVG